MLSAVMKEAAIRAKVEPRLVTDIVVGNLLQIGQEKYQLEWRCLWQVFQ